MMPISLAILAGGKSRRMGVNKAFLRLGDKTVLEQLLARVQTLEWESIFLVANQAEDYAYLNLPIYPDILSDKAALGGIYSALEQSPTVDYQHIDLHGLSFTNINSPDDFVKAQALALRDDSNSA